MSGFSTRFDVGKQNRGQYAATASFAGGRRERFHDGLNRSSRLSSCSTQAAHRKYTWLDGVLNSIRLRPWVSHLRQWDASGKLSMLGTRSGDIVKLQILTLANAIVESDQHLPRLFTFRKNHLLLTICRSSKSFEYAVNNLSTYCECCDVFIPMGYRRFNFRVSKTIQRISHLRELLTYFQ